MAISARPASPEVRHVEIGPDRAGQRLDNFLLATLKGVPRSHVYRLLRRGEVRVNRGRAKPEYRLEEGDVVRIPPVRTAISEKRLASGESFAWLAERILHEDEHLIVVDKPPGLAVHGGSGVAVGLIEALRALRPDQPGLELAHRLDRETSGCLLVAKTRQALGELHRQLREGEVHKHYLALVMGVWRGGARTVSAALARGKYAPGERQVRVAEEGKASASRFTPQRRFVGSTLVEVELFTGRTHQARVHAAHLGQPIACDDKYGDYEFNRRLRRVGLKRLFLHAARLEFRHPVSGLKLDVKSPLPPDLEAVLARLDHETRA
jgi:23S rRNA pseudouridine955/2504/2580 synthase